ncbi:rust resistance kinase Lr10-like [Arachis ipaensis]|uniref:rust resistance kinase Lr10-like n=1 Tax=Arachis ipaensis TaxID=130454 RepID=UPI0007AF751F|nr:rust resistance kinase Lr10-like [Arachis ipaensis]
MPTFLLLLLLNLNLDIAICHDDPVPCPVRLYCSENKTNILELPGFPSSVKLHVSRINYASKTLQVYDPEHCFPELFLRLNYSSFYPFRSIKQYSFDDPLKPANCAALLVSILVALYYIYGYYRNKGEDQERVKTFLKDYEALNPTRFSYADIKRITKQFKDKLGEGAHGAVYKGKLSNQILVAVKILNSTDDDGKEFINEVGTMAKIHHVNVVRLLGYCADGSHRALVYHFFPNGNLQTFIAPSSNNETFLGWNKMHQIAIGIAKGIEYLHQGCDQRILHFDINPYNVLLDQSFTPKISDFGLAKLCSKNRSTVSMTAARGTLGYMAPEVFSRNFGNVSYKSDIYSYGMLLLEMVGGRKNTNMSQETFQVLYPNWIHNLLEGDDTYIPIDDDGDFKIAKKLAIVGLWCIQWHPVHRPSMKSVVQMLEAEEDNLNAWNTIG